MRFYGIAIKRKKALVTGSTLGIEKAIDTSLAAERATVIINGRNQDRIDQTIKDIETNILILLLAS